MQGAAVLRRADPCLPRLGLLAKLTVAPLRAPRRLVACRYGLRDIVKRVGVTTILVTHDQEEAWDIADRVRWRWPGAKPALGWRRCRHRAGVWLCRKRRCRGTCPALLPGPAVCRRRRRRRRR